MPLTLITTVTSPALSYNLTTLAVVKDELSITNGASDATLKRYLSWASAALAQECNRVFAAETVQDKLWPARQLSPVSSHFEVLQIARWPLQSITSLTETEGTTTTTLVEGTNFVGDYATGQLYRLDSSGRIIRWSACPKVIVYIGGYATIPGDLQDAVTRMVRNRYRAKGRDSFLMSENIPGVRDSRWWIATGNEAGNVPPDVADLIDSYRVPVIA